jgi:chemotaxis protein methyltransferase CheR
MFRDPSFYQALTEDVLPLIATYPFFRVWHAGCAAGQEVYSLAILLHEAGLRERVQTYATDFNRDVLELARQGVYPLDAIKTYTANYQKSGGNNSFADYYTVQDKNAVLADFLRGRILFSEHNLRHGRSIW